MNPAIGRTRNAFKRGALTVAIALFLGYGGIIAWLKVNEPKLVYQVAWSKGRERPLDPALSAVSLESAPDITLDMLVARADSAHDIGYWILLFHGNGATVRGRTIQGHIVSLRQAGFSVLAPDYRGFGRSTGQPSEAGLYEDGTAAYRYLIDSLGVKAERVLLMGHSLGSGVAVELATRYSAAALVLAGAYTSVPDRGQELYPWIPVGVVAGERFANLEKMDKVKIPVLVAHAVGDDLIPFHHGERLLAAAHEPKMMFRSNGDHVDSPFDEADRLRDSVLVLVSGER